MADLMVVAACTYTRLEYIPGFCRKKADTYELRTRACNASTDVDNLVHELSLSLSLSNLCQLIPLLMGLICGSLRLACLMLCRHDATTMLYLMRRLDNLGSLAPLDDHCCIRYKMIFQGHIILNLHLTAISAKARTERGMTEGTVTS